MAAGNGSCAISGDGSDDDLRGDNSRRRQQQATDENKPIVHGSLVLACFVIELVFFKKMPVDPVRVVMRIALCAMPLGRLGLLARSRM
jgi:hypothetical protein